MTPSSVASALSHVFDPELGIDVVSLGLVYSIDCVANDMTVAMTTTSASCPMGPAILQDAAVILHRAFPGATVSVEFTDEPAWHPDMLSQQARSILGLPMTA